MSNTLAQNPSAASYSGATSVSVLFGSGMTNSSLVLVELTIEQPTATATIADNKNAGNYTQDVTATQNAGGGGDGKSIIASKQNTQTAAATVTATLSTNCEGMLKVQEYTGAATSSALDTSNSGNGTNSQPSVSITTGTANCTVVACSTHYGGGAVADTNYTASYTETGINNAYHFGEHRVDAGASGSITLQMGLPSNESGWGMAVAAYKTAGGSGAISGTTTLTFGQSGALTGSGALAGTTPLTFGQSGSLTGAGALAGSTTLTFGQSGTLKGAGALSGTTTLTFGATGTLDQPPGALAGTTTLTFGASGSLAGDGALAGTASLIFGASGTPDTSLIGLGPLGPVFASGGWHDPKRYKLIPDKAIEKAIVAETEVLDVPQASQESIAKVAASLNKIERPTIRLTRVPKTLERKAVIEKPNSLIKERIAEQKAIVQAQAAKIAEELQTDREEEEQVFVALALSMLNELYE